MLFYMFGGLVIAALFTLIRSPMHSRVLLTNIINTFVFSVKQFVLLFHLPKYNYVIVIGIMRKFFLYIIFL